MKKMQKMVPNMFTSPLAVKGDLSDKIDKAERWYSMRAYAQSPKPET
jgi:hypothetical protein